jgi:3-oxoacyl-[acyl-carrier protein] reductase
LPEDPLNGKVAVVTGCGKRDGMGRAIARKLAAAGISVVVSDVEPAGVLNRRQQVLGQADDEWHRGGSGGRPPEWHGVSSLVDEITAAGGLASAVLGDIGSAADAERIVTEAVALHGRLDILVNNAAAPQGLDRRDIAEVPIDVWDQVVMVNLRGTFLMCRFAVPVMREQRFGRIINIASMAGVVAVPRSAAYSASKAGILGLTRSVALDAAPWGITVNAICPGLVGTSRAILSEDPDLDVETELARRGNNIPVGRVGQPADIAAAVEYLASPQAGYLTGQMLVLDGGGASAFPLTRPAPADPS